MLKAETFNCWGREVRSREEAEARLGKALEQNPKLPIHNMQVVVITRVQELWARPGQTRTLTFYQARWYDYSKARKIALQARRDAEEVAKHQPKECPACGQALCQTD